MPKNRMGMVEVKVLGVDLAGSPHRISGICVLAFHKREDVRKKTKARGCLLYTSDAADE